MKPMVLNGGSPLVQLVVGKVRVNCIVDTGSPASVCLNQSKRKLIEKERLHKKIIQVDVDDDTVCSDVVNTTVVLAGKKMTMPILLTDRTDSVDGYIGLGLLRCFDMYISTQEIGFRYNGLPPADAFAKLHLPSGDC